MPIYPCAAFHIYLAAAAVAKGLVPAALRIHHHVDLENVCETYHQQERVRADLVRSPKALQGQSTCPSAGWRTGNVTALESS
jgi:hypothetical protein